MACDRRGEEGDAAAGRDEREDLLEAGGFGRDASREPVASLLR